MKKVVIVGAGIAGLSAGIHLAQNGYEVEIYEKQHKAGGLCSSWIKDDMFIDNCIYWLTGTKKGTELYKVWENVGVLGDDVEIIRQDAFYSVEIDGKRLSLWRDLGRTEKELIEAAPEDTEEIKKFIFFTKMTEAFLMPVTEEELVLLPIEMQIITLSLAREYGKATMKEFSERFHNPLVKALMLTYMSENDMATNLIYYYATITAGNDGIPGYGSRGLPKRMEKRLLDLGGKIFYNQKVENVVITNGVATGIKLPTKKVVNGDYVIAACDLYYVFHNLIDSVYTPKLLEKAYADKNQFLVESSFQVAYYVECDFDVAKEILVIDCEPIAIGLHEEQWIRIKNYARYDKSYQDHTIIQVSFPQYDEDYKYWLKLHDDKKVYNSMKMFYAHEILERILKKFPQYRGKIRVLDSWTPITYNRYCNSYQGGYMGFSQTNGNETYFIPFEVEGVENMLVANQWQMIPGGLPVALTMGKCAAERIIRKENT